MLLLSVIITILLPVLLYAASKKIPFELNFKSCIEALRNSVKKPFIPGNILLLSAFCIVILLPLFWGLSFYLHTDANVVAVLITFVWGYNLIKYIFLKH